MGFIITTQLVNEYPSLIRCDRTINIITLEFPTRITSQQNLRKKDGKFKIIEGIYCRC